MVNDVVPVIAKTPGVDKIGAERVALFNRHGLSRGVRIGKNAIHCVRLRVVRVVIKVCPEQAVVFAQLVIHASCVEVFRDNLYAAEDEASLIPAYCGISARIKGQKRRGVIGNADACQWRQDVPCRTGRVCSSCRLRAWRPRGEA